MGENTERTTSANIEFLTKLAATFLGFVYLCGFLVVSIHLSEYGVYSIALLRGQYLAAGIMSLSPLCLTYFIAAVFHTSFVGFPFGPFPTSGWLRVKKIVYLIWKTAWGLFKRFAASSLFIDGFVAVFVPTVRDLLLSHWRVFLWITLLSMIFAITAVQIS
jgi:hypothetical protein